MMRLLRNAPLSSKIAAANLVGLAALASALMFLYQTSLANYADHQAQKWQISALRVAWDVLGQQGQGFRIRDGQLLAGDHPLNGSFEAVDRITALMGGTATIFMGDLRIATNVKKPDGSRAVGTRLAPGPVYEAVLKRGEPYRGKADILGQSYFTAYDPIKDASGAVLGVLYVGVPESEFRDELGAVQRRALYVAVIIVVGIGSVALWISGRMFSPLRRLSERIARVSQGELADPTPYVDRSDDIGRMARAVDALRELSIRKAKLDEDSERDRALVEEERRRNDETRAISIESQSLAIRRLAEALKQVAAGNLIARLGDGFSGPYQQIRDDFNEAIGQLKFAMAAVISSTSAITSGVRDITSATDDLSRRTSEHAADLAETAATLGAITETIKASSERASQSRTIFAAAGEDARHSAVIVAEAIEAIHAIAKSGRQIGETIAIVDEIAFQTNLLALNAGVEAARAGEAGRGFAVVASEVRALALRSAEAAKQIKTLVSTSTELVDNGVLLIGKTGQSLDQIIAKVTRISASVSDMARDAVEQAKRLDEVNRAVSRMDGFTQRNAAMAEQSMAATRNLSQEALRLAEMAGRFQLEDPRRARAA